MVMVRINLISYDEVSEGTCLHRQMIEMSLLDKVSVCGVITLHRGQNPILLQAKYTNRHKGNNLKPYMNR